VAIVEASEVSARSASQAEMACRVSSSSTAGRSLRASHWEKYRTLWLYSSIVRGALAAALRWRR
jgi:hypothetical protein